nr:MULTISPECIES: hypothetical protein [Bacillus cereus group]
MLPRITVSPISCCKTLCIGKTQQSQRQPSAPPVGPVGPVGKVNGGIGGSVGPIKFGFNTLA